MNTRSKLVLSLAALLAVSGAAAGTATYAWFNTLSTATVQYTKATVTSNAVSLDTSFTQLNGWAGSIASGAVAASGNAGFTLTASNNITDISGDGKNFYKPNFKNGQADTTGDHTTGHATTISQVTSAADKYVLFGIKFTNNGGAAINVFFAATSDLTPEHTITEGTPEGSLTAPQKADRAAVNGSRVALWSTGETPALTNLWQPKSVTNASYLKTAATGATAYDVDSYTFGICATDFGTKFKNGAYTADTTTTGSNFIVNIPSKGDVTLACAMWIEGCNPASNDAAIGGEINLKLDFTAMNA